MLESVRWDALPHAPIEGPIAVLDTNIVYGMGAKNVDGKQAFKLKSGGAKGRRAISGYSKEIMDAIATQHIPDTVLIPDSVVKESRDRVVAHYEQFREDVAGNDGAQCYEVQLPFDVHSPDAEAFLEFEQALDERWKQVTAGINGELGKLNWMTDRSVLYTGLHAKESFPQSNVRVVSDDRGDINNGTVFGKLSRVNIRYRENGAKIVTVKGSNFARRLRERI